MGHDRLAGKAALITGGTGGIGEATAKAFLDEGASVMLVGRSAEKLEQTLARLDHNGKAATAVADAADEDATAAAVRAAVEIFGGVDILFANAGYEGNSVPLETVQKADLQQLLDVNVVGVCLAMKHCIGPMRERGGGSMIATSSIAGVTGLPLMAAYVASKHAVIGLVRSAAVELAGSGIRVNAIAPGPVDNRMIRSLETQFAPEAPDAVRADIMTKIPMGRYGTNDEVAQLALFLAGGESSYCTGSVFMLDGGYSTA